MRFSSALYQVNYYRHFKRVWKRQSRLEATALKIPQELQEMGVTIKDAREILLETQLFPQPLKKPTSSLPVPPSVFQLPKCYYVMHNETKVSENENQTLALTKTIPYVGLPASVTSLIGKDSLPNQEELVRTSLLQAQVWDGDQIKLPKLFDPENPSYVFKRAYGIRNEKKVSELLEKLTLLCEAATGKYPASLQRDRIYNAFCDLSITRSKESITFKMLCDMMLVANEPLKRFSTPSDVAATSEIDVPSIFPIKPTLDLDKVEKKPESGILTDFNNRHIHTIFLAQKSYDEWLPNQMLSQAIANAFVFCAKEAQRKFGENVKELPEPISIQCSYMDLKTFNFIAYQLNTLDLENNEGIKNQVWIDEPSVFYDEISETNLVTNCNPQIFPKLLAFYSNGLHHQTAQNIKLSNN